MIDIGPKSGGREASGTEGDWKQNWCNWDMHFGRGNRRKWNGYVVMERHKCCCLRRKWV